MYKINPEKCSACGLCADICLVEAISVYGFYQINAALCIQCGLCGESCPVAAIEKEE